MKSYTAALQVLVLAAIVPIYGKLADRLPRRRLINLVTLFFAISFAVFALPVLAGVNVAVVFYVWVRTTQQRRRRTTVPRSAHQLAELQQHPIEGVAIRPRSSAGRRG